MQVKEAMNEINAAQRLRLAAVEKADASKIRVIKDAEAEAESKFLQGAGVARQRQVSAGYGLGAFDACKLVAWGRKSI
jgi:hypothetical protein